MPRTEAIVDSTELIADTRARVAASRTDSEPAIPLLERITQFAKQCPERVALADGATVVTYGELDRRTAALGALLSAAGVRRGDVVPVVFERGVRLIEALIAVWRAGAAFLPLDPAAPVTWLRESARRAGVSVVLAESEGVVPGRRHVVPSEVDLRLAVDVPRPDADELAYVIQTSGSTGTPKLVMVHHGGLGNLVRLLPRVLTGVGPGATVLQFSAPTFDGIVFDMALALGHGARLEVLDSSAALRPLTDLLRDRRISHVALPAAVVRTLKPEDFPDLRVVLSVGEACQPATAHRWARAVQFINGYGPTEATIGATMHFVDPDARYTGSVPIGRALPNCHVVIADEALNPVPYGVEGEILVGGDGVGLGYLNDEAGTRRAFVPDPFTPVARGRLYRTGDLGRMLPDGTVEFLGRTDQQHKIRGFRVDLSEVEFALLDLDIVRDAKVVADRDPAGGVRVIGYVQPATPRASGDAVLAELRQRVPRHLLPSVIMMIDDWPLLANGKVDVAGLPRPMPASSAPYAAPRTRVEEILARIAADLLRIERIGIHSGFSEMGGDSLLAMRFVARVSDELGKSLDLSAVLGDGTIAEIGHRLDNAAEVVPPPRPGARGSGKRIPSRAQERVWLMGELAPTSLAYNAQAVIAFSGELSVPALNASLTDIVRRHEVLRSAFSHQGGKLSCEVVDPWEVRLPVLDLTDAAHTDRDRLFSAAVRDVIQAPFDLERDRLVRWLLIKIAEDHHVLVHVEHHIVHDGWSFNVFLNDLLEGYTDYLRHGEVRRPPLPLQYYDYADWQNSWCRSDAAAAQRRFWRDALAGVDGILPLPGRSTAGPRKFRGASPRVEIDAELANRLVALCNAHGSTLFMTMLAAFFALSHRYSGARDMVVASGIANRRWPDTRDLLGMFVNTVVFRGRVPADDLTFLNLMTQVRETALNAYDNQELPFEDVLSQASIQRVDGVNPLVQVMFSFQDAPHRALAGLPLDVTVIEGLGNGSAKFDINVVATPRYRSPNHISRLPGGAVSIPASETPVSASPQTELDGITLSWEYDSDRFDGQFIRGMLEAYLLILRAVAADPGLPISELPLVSARGRAELVELGKGPVTASSVDGWLPAVVDQWVARTPAAIAVVGPDMTLNYRALSDRANHLAARLRATGVSSGDVVAVCLPPSADLIVSLLGVMRSGAAVTVLDVDHPAARLAWLLDDSGARAVVAGATTISLLPHSADGPVVLVLDGNEAAAPPPAGRPTDLAYLCYTSGSTGLPKGVQVEHHSAVTRMSNMDFFGLAPGKSILQLAPPAFDVAMLEIFGALAHGATIHLPRTGWHLRDLRDYLVNQHISHVWLVAPLLNQLFAEEPDALDRVEQVLTGADVVSPSVVRRLLARGVPEVINGYGPTEATVFASTFTARLPRDVGLNVSIGRPLPNTSITLVDQSLRPVPRGVFGEIFIEGPCVARGYHNRPELSAAAFVDGGYRTGDLARWLHDGTLEFAGRRDSQVKIRGVRVELGEVSTVLTDLPDVKDAIATTDTDGRGNKRLIAYVIPVSGRRPTAESLRSALAEKLPRQLVPSVVTVVDAWPMTAGGKIDRGRLPVAHADRDTLSRRPATETERALAAIAEELLGIGNIGAHDNFFALGGNSLLAMEFIGRAYAVLGLGIRLAEFFAGPTVARLAEAANRASAAVEPIGRLNR